MEAGSHHTGWGSALDVSRMVGAEPGAFHEVADYVAKHAALLAEKMTAMAIIRPGGLEGAIVAGGRTVGFRELEVELQAEGTRADLDALIDQLQARFALIPESRGKKKRGLALLDQAVGGLPIGSGFRPIAGIIEQADALNIGA